MIIYQHIGSEFLATFLHPELSGMRDQLVGYPLSAEFRSHINSFQEQSRPMLASIDIIMSDGNFRKAHGLAALSAGYKGSEATGFSQTLQELLMLSGEIFRKEFTAQQQPIRVVSLRGTSNIHEGHSAGICQSRDAFAQPDIHTAVDQQPDSGRHGTHGEQRTIAQACSQ